MDFIKSKIKVTLDTLQKNIASSVLLEYVYGEYVDYKTENAPSPDTNWSKKVTFSRFDGKDKHCWLHLNIPALAHEDGKEHRLMLDTGRKGWDANNPQFTVFIDGKTCQAFDINHTWMPLKDGKDLNIYIYLYTGMMGGEFYVKMSLQTVDLATEGLFYDLKIPLEAMEYLIKINPEIQTDSAGNINDNPNNPQVIPYDYIKIRDCLDKATMLLDFRDIGSNEYFESIDKTRKYLKTEFYEKICGNSETTISCIGHTHIDVAWLWTVAQTREKAQRSFATVLNMMDYFDDYKFMSSQPQLYQHIKEVDPEMFNRIKARVKEGRWEPEGAMWLEADTNLISGESLIRQIIYGKRFMKEEFGIDNKILWLPDVFGYSGALPQILQKCGITKFFTTKTNWNETNKLPHDVFIWEGIDGSQVFSSVICAYVLFLCPSMTRYLWDSFKDKSYSNHNLMTFGFGDGGGGPTYEMMENYERLKYGLPGFPKTKVETTGEFFDRQEENFRKTSKELKKEPKWVGELYLEAHRGTYTSLGKNKRNNRKSELLYQQAETLAVTDMILLGGAYPEEIFRKNQTKILLNQFHDIIPGSSIKDVYDITDIEYAEILKDGRVIADSMKNKIQSSLKTAGGVFVYNPTPFEITDYVKCDGNSYLAENVPAHGWKIVSDTPVKNNIFVGSNVIENNLIKITFNEKYHLSSIFDKTENREILTGEGNILQIFEDYPRDYDAWEITDYYNQKMWVADDVSDVTLLENGLEITRKYQKSLLRQKITLRPNSKRVDFDTYVDWHEDHVLLKAAFPVDIRSDVATYDIQFGNLKRPTHKNTKWDEAKFEVCAHKWADLSENGYGVSILNDCKYGYSIEENIMKITLLKAATYPNPDADRGEHIFTYSLYPHIGDFSQGGTVKEGYLLNMPLEATFVKANDGKLSDCFSIASSNKENVVVETIKKAEDDNSVIIRAYETYNSKVTAEITVGFDFKKVYLCDMLENNQIELTFKDKTVSLPFKNFEIITLKFELK